MSLSRVTALFLSILIHSIVLVGLQIPQNTANNTPVVINIRPVPNIAIEKRPPKPPLPKPDRPIKNSLETLPEECTPTPTSTIFPSPTQTSFPTVEPTAIPTRAFTPTPSSTPIPTSIPRATPPSSSTKKSSPPAEIVKKPTTVDPEKIDTDVFIQIPISNEETTAIQNQSDEPNLASPETIPGRSSTSGASSRNESIVGVYRQKILEKLQASRRYPRQARRKRIEGNVVVKFAIREDGSLLNVSIESSSGHEILDRATLDLVRKAFPMPPPLAETGEFRVTIRYSLKE